MNGPESFEFPRIAELLEREGFSPSRHRDQHFLRGRGHTRQIAEMAGLTSSHCVLEIGAGLGNLTCELARLAGAVVAVEKDHTFAGWHTTLSRQFPNLRFVYQDFLKTDLQEALPAEPEGGPLVAVGNLPYQITAPILFRLIDAPFVWEKIVVMVQLEVAERLAVGPKTRRASALTYKIALEYEARIAMRLGPQEFIPPPRVRSAVVVLTPLERPHVQNEEHKQRLHALIGGVFTHRRRTLPNAMVLGGLLPNRQAAERAVGQAGLDGKQRPETLSINDFLRLEIALQTVRAELRS